MGAPLADALNDDPLGASLARGGVEFRAALRDDVDFAFETLRLAMRDAVATAFGSWDDAEQRALFEPSFELRTHRILRADGRDVGVVAVEHFVDRIHLARIFVRPEAQRRGVGRRVLDALVADARERALPIALTVPRSNAGAIRFYDRLGFARIAETATHLHLELEPAHAAGST